MSNKLLYLIIFISIFFKIDKVKAKDPDRILRLNISQEFYQKDPRKAGDLTSTSIHFFLHESLMKMGPLSKNPEFCIAESYELDSNKTTYIFRLKNYKFSNGTIITSYDFINSWKEILSPDFPCPNIHLFYNIKNAKKVKTGELPFEKCGIKALDEKTIQIELEEPQNSFLEILCFCTFAPFKKEDIYSGPFIIKSHELQKHLHLEPNPYHQLSKTNPFKITFSFIKDEMTAFNIFEKGELDLLGSPFTNIPKEVLENIKNQTSIHHQPSIGITLLILNTESPIFKNEKLHLFLNNKINKETICSSILNGNVKKTDYIIPNLISSFHLDLYNSENDLTSYKKLEKPIKLIYPNSASYPKIAQYLEQQISILLNTKVELHGLESKLFFDKLKKNEFDLAMTTIFSQYLDPCSILDRFSCPNNLKNYAKYNSDTFRNLLKKAKAESNYEKKQLYFCEAEKDLLKNSGIIPLFETASSYIISDKIDGVRINFSGGFNFENINFKKDDS